MWFLFCFSLKNAGLFYFNHKIVMYVLINNNCMCPYLFNEADESSSKAPGFVSVALQWADGDLRRLLDGHRHHVNRVIHERRVRLQTHTHIHLLDTAVLMNWMYSLYLLSTCPWAQTHSHFHTHSHTVTAVLTKAKCHLVLLGTMFLSLDMTMFLINSIFHI